MLNLIENILIDMSIGVGDPVYFFSGDTEEESSGEESVCEEGIVIAAHPVHGMVVEVEFDEECGILFKYFIEFIPCFDGVDEVDGF